MSLPAHPHRLHLPSRRVCVLATAMAAVAGLAFAVWAGRPADPRALLARASDLVFAGHPREALAQTRRALASLDERSNLSLRLQALTEAAQIVDFHLPDSRLPEALDDYRQIARLAPGSPAAFQAGRRIAEILSDRLHDGLHAEAQYLAVADAFPKEPGSAHLLLQAARLALEGRRYQAAQSDAARLLAAFPQGETRLEAQLVLGQADELMGRIHDALMAFDALADASPNTPVAARALFEAGNCLAEQGDWEHAIASYVEALPFHPDPTVVQQSLARARRHFTAEAAMKPGSHGYAFARNQ